MSGIRMQVTGITEQIKRMDVLRNKDVPFVAAATLTQLAKLGQKEIQQNVLPAHFVLRNAGWMKRNIRITPATKTRLEAELMDTFAAMGLQESGGTKLPYGRFIAVPLSGVKKWGSRSLIPPESRPHAVMQRGGFIRGNIMFAVELKAGRRGRVSRAIGGIQKSATWTRVVIPMYALVPRAAIRARYGFVSAVVPVVEANAAPVFAEMWAKYADK